MEEQYGVLNPNLIFSEVENEYNKGIVSLAVYLGFEPITQDQMILIKERIIPAMLFQLSRYQVYDPMIQTHLQIFSLLLQQESVIETIIENMLLETLYLLKSKFGTHFDSKIVTIMKRLVTYDEMKKYNIPRLIRVLFGVEQVMQMTCYQPYYASKIRLINYICDISGEKDFQQIEPFINELIQVLNSEENDSEQFFAAVDILSQVISFNKVKQMIVSSNNLKKIIETIPKLINQYRVILDSILVICLQLILHDKMTEAYTLHCGLLQQLKSLISCKIYGIHYLTNQILLHLCKDELIVNRLFLNSIINTLIEKYRTNPFNQEMLFIFSQLFTTIGTSIFRYKSSLDFFVNAFFISCLELTHNIIFREQIELIILFQSLNIYQTELYAFFRTNVERLLKKITVIAGIDFELCEKLINCYPKLYEYLKKNYIEKNEIFIPSGSG